MARFSGKVGYGKSVETPADIGVFVDEMTEYDYYGDVVRSNQNLQESQGKLNDDITVSNSISIVADEYAIDNFIFIKYVMWSGIRWRVSSVEFKRPRLILTLGGVYNGPIPD